MSLSLKPTTLKEAKAFVGSEHRHHAPPVGHKFSIGVVDADQSLQGVVVVGRPVARGSDDGWTAEVTRLATNGAKNACSMLYGAAARAAKAMGYRRIQTYILESEPGTSLRAAGWVSEGVVRGRQWRHTDGKPRRTDQPTEDKERWAKTLAVAEPESGEVEE